VEWTLAHEPRIDNDGNEAPAYYEVSVFQYYISVARRGAF
jgi:hypothetical protein